MRVDDEITRATLEWINEVRGMVKPALLKLDDISTGGVGGYNCPVAQSLLALTDGQSWAVVGMGKVWFRFRDVMVLDRTPTPPVVAAFIDKYDNTLVHGDEYRKAYGTPNVQHKEG